MYIFKNAWKNIIRNKSRNILLGIIVVVIACACSITLAIRGSANKIVDAYASQYNIEATIGTNRDALMQSFRDNSSSQEDMINQFNDIENLSVEEINKYGDSEYVSSYYYTYSINMDGKNLEEATDSLVKETTKTETTTQSWGSSMPSGIPGGFPGGAPGGGQGGKKTTKKTTTTEKIFNDKAADGAFNLVGYSSYESMSEFIGGTYTITSGSVFTDIASNEAIVSSELATLNELEVGDKITMVNPYATSKTYELVISGIYEDSSESASDMRNMFSNSANKIITTSTIIEKMVSDLDKLSLVVTPTFVVDSEEDLEMFKAEVIEKGLSEYLEVTDNLEEVTGATESIVNVRTFATTFLIITLVIGGVVLLVINMINIRERKYEIGVLRTVGMKKSLVIGQFVTELLAVSIVGLMIGALCGSFVSVDLANNLLENEISNASEKMNNINMNFGGFKPDSTRGDDFNFVGENKINGIINLNQVDSIEAVVDLEVLVKLLLIGIGLTMFSSISACISIARFSPLTILKERS